MTRKIDISHKTIFFISGFLALLWALFLIRDVILLLFVAIILMSAIYPIVDFLMKYKIPKVFGIAIVYVLIIGFLAGLISIVITPLVEQTKNLALAFPLLLEQLFPPGSIDESIIQQEISAFSRNALTVTLTLFGNFLAIISIAVLTFYLLMEKERAEKLLSQFFIGRDEKVKRIIQRIEYKLGAWLRGQLILSLVIGVMSYVVLTILGVPFALPLAIVSGLLEVVPVIGPIISAIPAVLIAYVTSPVLALMVGISYFVIQQLENHLIVPQVMRKAVGLNPLIIILAIAIGGRLLGITGALLAVPITVVAQIIAEELLKEEEKVGA